MFEFSVERYGEIVFEGTDKEVWHWLNKRSDRITDYTVTKWRGYKAYKTECAEEWLKNWSC